MNDIIQDLAYKAGTLASLKCNPGSAAWHQAYSEIFAELIVKQCMVICLYNGETAQYSATPAKARAANAMAKSCAHLLAGNFGIKR